MSLTKLLKAPIKFFKKDVITFVVIRRFDRCGSDDEFRYIAVKPSASISVLRQKVWHLLDLPDYCEEVIVLKSNVEQVIPLTELRKGNDPQHPYILEVWSPGNRFAVAGSGTTCNMLTIQNGEGLEEQLQDKPVEQPDKSDDRRCYEESLNDYVDNVRSPNCIKPTMPNNAMLLNKMRIPEEKMTMNTFLADFKNSELSCHLSTSSIFKLNRKKSRENVTNILLKIQSDLNILAKKMSDLEKRINLE